MEKMQSGLSANVETVYRLVFLSLFACHEDFMML